MIQNSGSSIVFISSKNSLNFSWNFLNLISCIALSFNNSSHLLISLFNAVDVFSKYCSDTFPETYDSNNDSYSLLHLLILLVSSSFEVPLSLNILFL